MSKSIPVGLKRTLSCIIGSESLIDHPAGLMLYSYDSSLQTGIPQLVLLPDTTEQIAEIVALLYREGVPYSARGAGTNLSGGSVPARGGVVICLSKMRRILQIDPVNQTARVQPGVTNLTLQQALQKQGFFFAPDPASQRVSTIGGNIAENSGGPHCLKYGVTTNHVLGMRVVTPAGEILEFGSDRLYTPGLDLPGLFIGSEGTLGIATEIICRILPLPRATRTMLAVYDATEDAGQTVSDIIAAGILPATLEMMDNLVIRAVEESLHAGYPTDAGAVLIIEVDGVEEALGWVVDRIESICRRNRVRDIRIAQSERERDFLWAGRRGAFGAVARLFPNYSVSDGTVPRAKLPEVLRRVAQIGKTYKLPIGNVFHAGDGNLHPLIFFDARDRGQLDHVHQAGREILIACAEAGGTISGEHGIGTEKIEAMPLVFGEREIELMRSIKRKIDPADLCNPGKILPPPDSGRGEQVEEEPGPGIKSTSAMGGVPLYEPKDVSELCALMKSLGSKGRTFAAVGGVALFPGLPHLCMPDAIIRTKKLRTIVEHDAANLTATAAAGLSLGELQKVLRKENQFLPLDAPPQSTLGGIVAAGLPGPRRYAYGSARDAVLGIKFADYTGRILKAGGKTVKNVAGYDYGKLLIGSWGTLGILTEITFRLLPLPECSACFVAGFERLADAGRAGARILEAGLSHSLLTLLNLRGLSVAATTAGHALPAGQYALIGGAEGFGPAVKRQMAEMQDICAGVSAESVAFEGNNYAEILGSVVQACYPHRHEDSFFGGCISVRPEDLCGTIEAIEKMERDAGVVSSVVTDVSTGTIFTYFSAGIEGPAAQDLGTVLREAIAGIRMVTLLGKAAGSFITGGSHSMWQRQMKEGFDPHSLLNPGLELW
ncbi:MAG: FAD-binding oxidoreductase [Candidatus Abyssobacteria bacterium SURF_5]|uniref:FAD-binding oxidoreductase n=1 Tax=Abyssobacteria bacterium (strain SURF_5) TaxID=2093360 RepID=A0A3A4P7P7_ABYX5|nr:MAG: FAD-binding oxidoreductase [Candidatus Abyssubacteria bacterium SURF_5]